MELDLPTLISWGKGIFAAILALVAAITAGLPLLAKLAAKAQTEPKPLTPPANNSSSGKVIDLSVSDLVQPSSDKAPPVGFVEHAQMIVDSAPYASSDVQLDYVLQGLTKAQTSREEVLRLGSLITPAPTTKAPSATEVKGVAL